MVLTACAAGVWAQDTLAFPNPRYWFRYNDTMQIFGTLGGMAECFYFYGIEYIPTEARTVYGISLWTSFIPEDMDLHVCAILMKRENGEYVRVDSVCTNNKEIAHYMEQAIPTCTSWNGGPDGAWKMVDYFFGQGANISSLRMCQLFNYLVSGEFTVPFYCASVIQPDGKVLYKAKPKPIDKYKLQIDGRSSPRLHYYRI